MRFKAPTKSRNLVLILATLIAFGMVPAGPAAAADDPYAADPLGLFADFDETSYYTTKPDTFEVSICNPDRVDRTLSEVVDYMNNESGLPGYWDSVSNGQYSVSFVGGTNVPSAAGSRCWLEAEDLASGQHAAGLIIVPPGVGFLAKRPTVGFTFGRTWGQFESNQRFIQAGFWLFEHITVIWNTGMAADMARTFDWPYSFTGALPESADLHYWDNPMDLVSGALFISSNFPYFYNDHFKGHKIGTIAANRYAAGWIDPADVHIFRGGTDRVLLRAGWEHGTQMLVVPSGEQGHFLTLGTRVAKHHDENIPKEGVESYLIDQRPGASQGGGCTRSPCSRFYRRTIPFPHSTEFYKDSEGFEWLTDPTMHVNQPSDEFTWNNITISVLRRVGDSYEVEITDGTPSIDHFTDDNGSVHEADINQIAAMGITRGCATAPTARYCPDAHVTRAEMAAFLLRATGEPDPQRTVSNTFTDVPDGVWYTNYALRAAQLGVDVGEDGQWRPDDPLTRLEMAQWLTRMFDHVIAAASPQGLFDDVNEKDWPVVEGLHGVGVTRGCSAQPLLYCPDNPVTRAEMASFLIRSLPPN